jgi:NAD(P)-dependent dehydrogenase (short-subunit alcohol dehydrogenase family)
MFDRGRDLKLPEGGIPNAFLSAFRLRCGARKNENRFWERRQGRRRSGSETPNDIFEENGPVSIMKFDFAGQVAVITGAAGNLGSAVARAFSGAGAKLALIDRTTDRFPTLFPDFAQSPDCFFAPPTDGADSGAVALAVDKIKQRFGRIDILVNTIGGYRAGATLHESQLKDWEFMLGLNARSVFVMCHAVIPQMLVQNRGRIVNVASRSALRGDAGHATYSASKAAVIRLTESMDAELKDRGVSANCVMPAIIDTPQNRAAMPDAEFDKWVTLEALADVILFLSSEGARAIHGAAIPVYGRS